MSVTRDKQLRGINLQAVRLKRDSDQALNAKEFAVLAGISYSLAREWFHLAEFPRVGGMVFWKDFVLWRQHQGQPKHSGHGQLELESPPPRPPRFTRAAGILSEIE